MSYYKKWCHSHHCTCQPLYYRDSSGVQRRIDEAVVCLAGKHMIVNDKSVYEFPENCIQDSPA